MCDVIMKTATQKGVNNMKTLSRFGHNLTYDLRHNRPLLIMILPVIIYIIIFNYAPMAGAVIAFKQYNFAQGIFGSPWCGFNNFRFFFMSGKAWQVTQNTVLYNAAFIVVQNTLEIAAAIFLSEISGKHFKKFTQGAMFLPNFISWVVVGAIAYNLLSYDFGFVNSMLTSMGMEKWSVYTDASYWPGIFVFLSAWKHVGYGSIIYLAAIMGIGSDIYESAALDGANEWQKIRYITARSQVHLFRSVDPRHWQHLPRKLRHVLPARRQQWPFVQLHGCHRYVCVQIIADKL